LVVTGFFRQVRDPLGENRFLQTGKGDENSKEKIQAMLYIRKKVHAKWLVHS
jgi:hypothetical protein